MKHKRHQCHPVQCIMNHASDTCSKCDRASSLKSAARAALTAAGVCSTWIPLTEDKKWLRFISLWRKTQSLREGKLDRRSWRITKPEVTVLFLYVWLSLPDQHWQLCEPQRKENRCPQDRVKPSTHSSRSVSGFEPMSTEQWQTVVSCWSPDAPLFSLSWTLAVRKCK